MKTFSKIIFIVLFLVQLYSCESENSNCADDNSNEEFIKWSLNDVTADDDYDNIFVYYADDRMLYINAIPIELGDGNGFGIIYDALEKSAHYCVGSFNHDSTFLHKCGINLEMTISSFSSTGDLICIQFDDGEFSGELRVILDKIVESGTVEGKVWLDENKNGINEPNESPLANVNLELITDSEILPEELVYLSPSYYPSHNVKTDENGHFVFIGVFIEHSIQVEFSTYDDIKPTTANVGNDDTVDSDFYLTRDIPDKKWYATDPFIIEDGDTKNDIGLGIIEE